MKYKKTATFVAGTLLALGTGTAAHAVDAPQADSLSTNDVGHLLASTDDVMDALHDGGLHREDGTLVKGSPKSTGMTIADIPLGVSTPD